MTALDRITGQLDAMGDGLARASAQVAHRNYHAQQAEKHIRRALYGGPLTQDQKADLMAALGHLLAGLEGLRRELAE